MELQNNSQESNVMLKKANFISSEEFSTFKNECLSSDFSVLQFPEYKNRTSNLEQHLVLFNYILEASETAMAFFGNLLSLFGIPLDVLESDSKYVIYDVLEGCKVVNLNFYELINSINIHLKDCIRLEYAVNLKDMVEIAFDFIDSHSIFLEKSLSNFEKLKLDELQLNIIPFNEVEGEKEEKKIFYENDSHQFEDFLLNYIVEIGVLGSDMVRELKLKLYLDEYKTIERFKEITEIDYKDLELKLKKLKQSANNAMEKAKLKHIDNSVRIKERSDKGKKKSELKNDDDYSKINDVEVGDEKKLKVKFENKNEFNEFAIEQGDYVKNVKLPKKKKNRIDNIPSVKHSNKNLNFPMSTESFPVNFREAADFSVNNASMLALVDKPAHEKNNLQIFMIVFGVSFLIGLICSFFYLLTKFFGKKNNDRQKYRKIVSQDLNINFKGMKLLESTNEGNGTFDNLKQYLNTDFSKKTSLCKDIYIEPFHTYLISPECSEPQDSNSPSSIFIKKANELTTNLQLELFKLFGKDKNSQKTSLEYFIFDFNGCKVMDLDFNIFQPITVKHSRNCKDRMNILLDSEEVIVDLIDKLNNFTLQTLSVFEKFNLTALKLNVVLTNGTEETVSFYKNIDYQFEKILLEFISKRYNMIGDLPGKFDLAQHITKNINSRHDILQASLRKIGDVANYVYKQDNIMEDIDSVLYENTTDDYTEYSDDEYLESEMNSGASNDQNNEFEKFYEVNINRDFDFHQNTINDNEDQQNNTDDYYEEDIDDKHYNTNDYEEYFDDNEEQHNITYDFYENYIDSEVNFNEQLYEEEKKKLFNKILSRNLLKNSTDNLTNAGHESHFFIDKNTNIENDRFAMNFKGIPSDETSSLWYFLCIFIGLFCSSCIIGTIIRLIRLHKKKDKNEKERREVNLSLEDSVLLDI